MDHVHREEIVDGDGSHRVLVTGHPMPGTAAIHTEDERLILPIDVVDLGQLRCLVTPGRVIWGRTVVRYAEAVQ